MNKRKLAVVLGIWMLGMGVENSLATLAWVGNGPDRAGLSSGDPSQGAPPTNHQSSWQANWSQGDTIGLVKFDLTPYQAPAGQRTVIDNAQFRFMTYTNGNSWTNAFYQTTDDWNSSVTWSTKPARGPELGRLFTDGAWGGGSTHFLYDSRIKTWVQQAFNSHDTTLSLYMQDVDGPVGSGSQTFTIVPGNVNINMNYHFEPVPEPATLSLLGLGLLGFRRKFSRFQE